MDLEQAFAVKRVNAALKENAATVSFGVAVSTIVGLRLVSLAWSSYSQEYGFLEAHYSFLAADLDGAIVPKWWGAPIYNTPPLYVWILGVWAHFAGWSEVALRLPSAVAYAATALPVYGIAKHYGSERAARMAVLVWLTFPLSFIVGGKVMPDVLLTAFMAASLHAAMKRRLVTYVFFLVLGVLVKPVAILVAVVPLVENWKPGWRATFALGALGCLAAALTGYGVALLHHVVSRWPGHLGVGHFATAFVVGSGTACMAVAAIRQRWFRSLWIYVAVVVGFALFAMPAFVPHEYYWLPALPAMAVLAGAALSRVGGGIIMVPVGLCLLVAASMDNGDFWDTRLRELAKDHDPLTVENGMSTVVSWYEGREVSGSARGQGGIWFSYYAVGPECYEVEQRASRWESDGPIYVVNCPPVEIRTVIE